MGALTLKAFSDELREWELIESESIDPTDSFGVSLRLSIREDQIFLAEPNDSVIPWLTDKGRLFFDGLFDKNSISSNTNWKGFFQDIMELVYFIDHLNFQKKKISPFLFAFENINLEVLNMLYILKQNFSFIDLRKVERYNIPNDLESNYQLSVKKPKLHMSTLGLLINTNPRYEGYILNLSLRQRILKGDFKLLNIGSMLDLTFPVYNLGSNFGILQSVSEGSHLCCQDFKNSEFPIIITNSELFKRSDAKAFTEILKYANVLDGAWNVLNHNLSNSGIQSLNKFLPLSFEDSINFFGIHYINVSLGANSNMKKIIDLHLLNIFSSKNTFSNKFFVDQNVKQINECVYKESGGLFDKYFYLPSSMFLEDNETYVNTEGSIKRITKTIHFRKNAKSNWQITRKLYSSAKSLSFFNNKKDNNLINFDCVNFFNFRNYINFQFYAIQTLTSLTFYLTKENSPLKFSRSNFKSLKMKMSNTKIKDWVDDFFNSNGKDSFSYNSSVLVNCSKSVRLSSTNFF